ncbi:MAG: VOC family protein [Defluviitaleaceae bacterium]|nr:VOC family protein [Defluviitaleaceae bacterium]
MEKGNITGLAHIGVFVKDMAASIDFYKRLGFTLDAEESVGVKLAFLSAGTCLIELIEIKDTSRPAGVVDHVAMTVDDIEAAVARANANGIVIDAAKISAAPILGGIKNVFFEGPDGERLEFFEYVK